MSFWIFGFQNLCLRLLPINISLNFVCCNSFSYLVFHDNYFGNYFGNTYRSKYVKFYRNAKLYHCTYDFLVRYYVFFNMNNNLATDRNANTQNTYHIFRKFMSRQIFDVLVQSVDDVSKLLIINDLLIHVHCHSSFEYVVELHDIRANDLRDRRAPEIIRHMLRKDTLHKKYVFVN